MSGPYPWGQANINPQKPNPPAMAWSPPAMSSGQSPLYAPPSPATNPKPSEASPAGAQANINPQKPNPPAMAWSPPAISPGQSPLYASPSPATNSKLPANERSQLDEETKARVKIDIDKEARMEEVKKKIEFEMNRVEKALQTDCGSAEQQLNREKIDVELKFGELARQVQSLEAEGKKLTADSKLVAEGDLGALEAELKAEEIRFTNEFEQMQDLLIGPVNSSLANLANDFQGSKDAVMRKFGEVQQKLDEAMNRLRQ